MCYNKTNMDYKIGERAENVRKHNYWTKYGEQAKLPSGTERAGRWDLFGGVGKCTDHQKLCMLVIFLVYKITK